MTSAAFPEDPTVEQPAIALFAQLGWETVNARDEVLGLDGTLGRESRRDAVLVARLRAALGRLNPDVPDDALQSAMDVLTRDRSSMGLVGANRELYSLLKDGVLVSIPDRENGGQRTERIRVIDWDRSEGNDFLLASQVTVVGEMYNCRPDLIGYVNGLPLLVVEVKRPTVPARQAYDDNLTHYKRSIPALFGFNALLIASNGLDSRVGSLSAAWKRFARWKRVEREDEPRTVSLETVIRGVCDRSRLLDIVENFTLFVDTKDGPAKIVAQNHQYLGVNAAIASLLAAREGGHGRGGVFWQTQGSGKSYSMVFFSQKVLRRIQGDWSFVVVTDRVELDDQIARNFVATGAVTKIEGDEARAQSGRQLRELLAANRRYVFTLIHKFQSRELLTDRADVVVMVDEAHRSQYDTLAMNMRAAMPKAVFLAFTGTPLIALGERTRETFGEYVSIYDFQQSVEDGATVPLFYDNRAPQLNLVNADIDEEMRDMIERAGLDSEEEEKLEQVLGRQYELLTRDDRLEIIASDIVTHFLGRGFLGKAMVVSIDKATAVRMYDKVRKHWLAEQARVEGELARTDLGAEDRAALEERLKVLGETDMAVVVSPAQNEIEKMREKGLEIEPHRHRMNEQDPSLGDRFKDPQDPLRIVFVCAMWLTGFDAPSCSTLYLDKPMRNHTLMQTIARANRVFEGKHSGFVVDYANVILALKQALAIYGVGQSGASPVKDKSELITGLREAVAEACAFCLERGVDVEGLQRIPAVPKMQRLNALAAAVDRLAAPDTVREKFFDHERLVTTIFRAVKPDPAGAEFAARAEMIVDLALAVRIQTRPDKPDVSEVLGGISRLLDRSITGLEIRNDGPPPIDLSKVDFAELARRFRDSNTKNTDLEALKAAVKARLARVLRLNRTRTDFREKFESLVEEYNAGSRDAEQLAAALIELTQGLDAEEQRHVRESLTIEELVIFDILTRPAPVLTDEERASVRRVAKEMLARVKELLAPHWREKAAARAGAKLAIEDALDSGLPEAYSPEMFRLKVGAVFEHIYESYPSRDSSVYSGVA